MRDLSTQELGFVYGAGASPMPPTKKPKTKKNKCGGSSDDHGKRAKHNKGGSGEDRGNRCGKGGSS